MEGRLRFLDNGVVFSFVSTLCGHHIIIEIFHINILVTQYMHRVTYFISRNIQTDCKVFTSLLIANILVHYSFENLEIKAL